eukprot:CAMPEP_0114512330 /NCGR_PEP_ID=MMETSP0109-20121206/14916_1 /TAXON_ID=29199 /ORGANISM="Chlorarachnion reptans, Strain CCCM449" /LENGTH=73 /DNA_ID=CAMNT_0001692003 /DNA_START=33 /DNA_END=254 /DNA_ORIENTATION=-
MPSELKKLDLGNMMSDESQNAGVEKPTTRKRPVLFAENDNAKKQRFESMHLTQEVRDSSIALKTAILTWFSTK